MHKASASQIFRYLCVCVCCIIGIKKQDNINPLFMNLIILADYQQCGIVVLISCVGNAVCVRACVCSMVGCLGSVCLRPYSEACVF